MYKEKISTLNASKSNLMKEFLTQGKKTLTYEEQIYRVSQEERTKLREGVPYVKLYRYNPKHLCPKLNNFRDNGK